MSPTDLNALKARLGSLSFEARSKLATSSPAVFKLVTVDIPALIAEVEEMREALRRSTPDAVVAHRLARIRGIVNEQAEDEALWFVPAYISEDFLQRALRRLHAEIEA